MVLAPPDDRRLARAPQDDEVRVNAAMAGHRRAGHGAAAFRALASHMAAAGKQPVWCAEDDNVASTTMAARLGFEPVNRIGILKRSG